MFLFPSISILFSALLALLNMGCGAAVNPKTTVNAPLKFSIQRPMAMPEAKQEIYAYVHSNAKAGFPETTWALVQDHQSNWVSRHSGSKNPSTEEALALIRKLADGIVVSELGDAKELLEKRLAERAKAPLKYNGTAISLFDLPYASRLQAYSGTVFTLLALRESWGRDVFEAANLVAIFESGHVLPGYLTQKEGVWHLTGVETTVEGKGKVLYGPLSTALKEYPLRIVDAGLFVLVDLFKFEAEDPGDLANQALMVTAKKYGIEKPFLVDSKRFVAETNSTKVNWSPFGFGYNDSSRNDRPRTALQEMARNALPKVNPNITLYHMDPPTSPPKKSETEADLPEPEEEPLKPFAPITRPLWIDPEEEEWDDAWD